MSQRGLEALLRPKSIAVLGASVNRRAGYLMMRNLLAGGFGGPVLPVTPTRRSAACWLAGRSQPALRPRRRLSAPTPDAIWNCYSSWEKKAVKPALFYPRRPASWRR